MVKCLDLIQLLLSLLISYVHTQFHNRHDLNLIHAGFTLYP